jgi:hypothetical protein
MKTTKGTFRLIYESALLFAGRVLVLYITLPLFIAWFILGHYVDLSGSNVVSAISGPLYFCIPYMAIAGFHTLFPVAVGMGSTRGEFLKNYYAVSLAGLFICLVLLNAGQYVLVKSSHIILNPGLFLIPEYHFFSYLWLDLIFGIFLFGGAFLCYAVWYRLGTTKSVIICVIVAITGMFLFSNGVAGSWSRLAATKGWIIAMMLTLLSLVSLFLTYPILKGAPLYPKSR